MDKYLINLVVLMLTLAEGDVQQADQGIWGSATPQRPWGEDLPGVQCKNIVFCCKYTVDFI